MAPYASDSGRARALYRLPTVPERNRTLELCCRRDPLVLAGPWRGSEHACCLIGATDEGGFVCFESVRRLRQPDASAPLPFAPRSFELVVLHRTLDDLAASSQAGAYDAQKLLAQLSRVLVSGGAVAGCVKNRHSISSIVRRTARRLGATVPVDAAAYSVRALRAALQRATFVDIRIFSLLPGCESPLRLVDIDPQVSKLMFRHEVSAGRSHLLPFIARRSAVELGLYRSLLTRDFFFWARKPCSA